MTMTKEAFEIALGNAAHDNLRPEIDAEGYVQTVLDMMWDGETYTDHSGDTYHEIHGHYTHHGRPVVIS